MSPESLLLLHRAAHAELLAELDAERRRGRRPPVWRRAADVAGRALSVRGALVRARVTPAPTTQCLACA